MAYGTFTDAGGMDQMYLTTKEVADVLRVKERKVYDLAAAGEIPHRRITGKLLFPRAEILAWIEGNGAPAPEERPPVLTGSHDPLLDWAVRESGAALASLVNGSADGLDVFCNGGASLAGLHLPEAGGWNVRTVSSRGVRDCVLLSWASRARGLVLAPDIAERVQHFSDLKGMRVALRQPGAGAAALFDVLLSEHGLTRSDLITADTPARTESDAAAAIAAGEADATLGIQAMAQQFNLAFLPLLKERFDLLIDRRAFFTDPVQTLFRFTQTDQFRAKAQAMGGYGLPTGYDIRWVSP